MRVASHQTEVFSTHRKIGHFASIILALAKPPSMSRGRVYDVKKKVEF
jgi:hypothetical protein